VTYVIELNGRVVADFEGQAELHSAFTE
jgi:hypothetical protein